MQSTNPKELRAQLKRFLDMASKEPVRVLRRNGDAFILVHEKKFSEMQTELMSLQRKLLELHCEIGSIKEDIEKKDSNPNRNFEKHSSLY